MKRASNQCKKILTSRRGISMVEVIIALAVIAIVSASALTLVLSHARLEAQTLQTKEATNIAENIIECFRYADSEDEFNAALSAANIAITYTSGTEEYEVEQNGTTYILSITLTNSNGGLFKSGTELVLKVGTASDDDIVSTKYTKYI